MAINKGIRRSFFITFEGPEGSGKTTQAALLAKYLKDQGHPVLLTKEPGGTPTGQGLRGILLSYKTKNLSSRAELFLMLADRAQHVFEVIRPALKKGRIVISDRYGDATLAYQGYGRGFDLRWLDELNRLATQSLKPDLTFLLDLEPEEGLRRALKTNKKLSQKGKGDRFEQEALRFHKKVRKGYLALAQADPGRFHVIPVTGKSIQELHERIKIALEDSFQKRA